MNLFRRFFVKEREMNYPCESKMRVRIIRLAVVWITLSAGLAAAQARPGETLRIPRLTDPPKIDGVLDPAYEIQALKIENFVQLSPKENGVPTERTIAYLGFDARNLYIAFRCFDSQPKKVRCSITNRDNIIDDDWIVVFLDTFNEKRRAFTFILNPAGIQMDAMRTEGGGEDNIDSSWDTVFSSDGRIDEQGYTIEAAIPFKSFRFPDNDLKVWNLVLGRNLPRTGEVIIWPSMSRKIPGLLMQGGLFEIKGKVEKGKNLEIMPILTSLKREGQKLDLEPGVNLKYGINSDMTLDLTANPDFSHIEADAPQIDVNLRYALRYQEKRPFFMEGMEIFKYPEIEMVYTRRIIDPAWGAKISGKTGRFAYGILSAYDLHPSESLWDVHEGGGKADRNALFNIVRLKTDVLKDSYIGFSLADKEIDGSWNRVAGFDGQLRFKNKWFFSFQAMASKTRDDGRTTSFAPALYADLYYFSKYWGAGTYWMSFHPDFEASSGFVNRVDYRSAGAYTFFTFYPDKAFLNRIDLNFQVGQRDAYFSNTVQDRWLRTRLSLRFTEFNQLDALLYTGMERYADIEFKKTYLDLESQFSFIRWLPFSFFFKTGNGINYDPADAFLGYANEYGLSLNFKPSRRLQLGTDFSKETFWRAWGGKRLWDYNVVRVRSTYQVSKPIALRVIVDYNHFTKQIFGSFLVSYVAGPGTLFYLGFDSNYDRTGFHHYDRRDYSIFIKFSYWLRL
jgi:hypothetical protein